MRVIHLRQTVGAVHSRKMSQFSGEVRSIRFRISFPGLPLIIHILEIRSLVRMETQCGQLSPFFLDFVQMLIGSGLKCFAATDSLSAFADVQFAASGIMDGVMWVKR